MGWGRDGNEGYEMEMEIKLGIGKWGCTVQTPQKIPIPIFEIPLPIHPSIPCRSWVSRVLTLKFYIKILTIFIAQKVDSD